MIKVPDSGGAEDYKFYAGLESSQSVDSNSSDQVVVALEYALYCFLPCSLLLEISDFFQANNR
jgi:hypothetical protein